jgi:hypothetical protein
MGGAFDPRINAWKRNEEKSNHRGHRGRKEENTEGRKEKEKLRQSPFFSLPLCSL